MTAWLCPPSQDSGSALVFLPVLLRCSCHRCSDFFWSGKALTFFCSLSDLLYVAPFVASPRLFFPRVSSLSFRFDCVAFFRGPQRCAYFFFFSLSSFTTSSSTLPSFFFFGPPPDVPPHWFSYGLYRFLEQKPLCQSCCWSVF